MKLIKAEVLAIRLMVKWGVFGNGNLKWKWGGFNNKLTNCGECYTEEGERKILLGKQYVLNNTEEVVTNTILHEIAHALDTEERGDSKHDHHWRKWCRVVGCREERCNSKAKVKYKYNDACCGSKFGRHRIRSNQTYHCGSCDRELFIKQIVAKKYKLVAEDIISVR